MIVKFFRHGNANQNGGRSGGGGAVRDYLLKDKDDKTHPRKGATVFRGDPELTTEIINSIKHKSLYTSCVLSFAENEIDDDQKLNEILDSFENALFPNLDKDQYSMYAVKHTDKGRNELHIVFANVELKSDKALPVYYHRNDKNLIDSWKNVTIADFGLIDPNSPDRKRDLVKSQINFDDQTDDQQKEQIHDRIYSVVMQNRHIKSRADVVEMIKRMGYEVTRQGKKDNSISIKNPNGGRNLKLKGALYAPDFNRDQLKKDVTAYEANRAKRIADERAKLAKNLEYRAKRLEKKFGHIDRTPINNQLTADLDEIHTNGTAIFNEQVQSRLDEQKATLKMLTGQIIEQLYEQHRHSDQRTLSDLKTLHQTVIDGIDQIADEKVIANFDEIVKQYASSLDHIVTVDVIEHYQQAELARLAQLEQQRLEQQQRLDRLNLLASFDQYTLTDDGIDELEGMDYQALLDYQQQCIDWLQSVDDYAQTSAIDEYIENYQYYRATLNYLHESNLLEKKYIDKLMSELDQTADTATDPELVVNEGSDEGVAQLTPDLDQPPEPEPPQITLNQRQQIVFDIALKYFDENDPEETKAELSTLSDSELRAFENPYTAEHDEYVKLANNYAQSLHNKATATAQAELAQLKKLIPKRPDDTKLYGKQWDKAFEKWNNDRVLPESKVRNKEIELNNLRNQNVRATPLHFDHVAQDRPDLAMNEQEYKQFEQFFNEVNRALTELDRQQHQPSREQVKNSGMDK